MMRKLTFLLSSTLVSLPAFAQTPAPAASPSVEAAPTAGEAAPLPAAPPPAEPKKKGGGPSLSLDPHAPQQGGLVISPTEVNPVEEPEPTAEWKFDVSGYTRAPLRMSWGPPTTPNLNAMGDPMGAGTQFRSPAMVPDGNYVDWRYTNSMVGPWTELNFHYGNQRAKLTVQIASYNITDSGYRRLESQLGINQAFLTVNFPELWNEDSRLILNVGGFTNRYGAAGRYDGGKYETYLFARTHVVGETATVEQDYGNWTFALEEGFGGKIEPTPYYGAPGSPAATLPNIPIWDPYPGLVAQESTFVYHGHVGAVFKKQLLLGLHYIHVFANDNERAGSYNNGMAYTGRPTDGPGSERPFITIYGGDVKFLSSGFGDGYIGYAHLQAQNAMYLQDAVETLHSYGGVQLHDNFFGNAGANDPVTGSIDTVEFQYVLSLGGLMRYPQAFWGDGPDLIASVFGMFNYVKAPMNPTYDGIKKLKFGGDLTYLPLPWFGIGGRFDKVSINMDDSDSAFSVFSPRLIFKTAFVTHEQIIVQYSRYFYGPTAATSQFPYNKIPGTNVAQAGASGLGADKNALQIAATLWF
jgi:hypothetical protein